MFHVLCPAVIVHVRVHKPCTSADHELLIRTHTRTRTCVFPSSPLQKVATGDIYSEGEGGGEHTETAKPRRRCMRVCVCVYVCRKQSANTNKTTGHFFRAFL